MNWTLDLISQLWLGPSRISVEPEELVQYFNVREHILGREWMTQARHGAPGTTPTLRVAVTGQKLAALDGLANSDALVKKLRSNHSSAYAELEAIHLLRAHPDIDIELEPEVIVGVRSRRPDFRARLPGTPWTYIEVTAPNLARAEKRVRRTAAKITELVLAIEHRFSLEVYLRREPTDEEVNFLLTKVPAFCLDDRPARNELPYDLGLLIRNESPPLVFTSSAPPAEELVPRLGTARGITNPPRHILVSIPYADERAARVIEGEAAQLPNDSPGLIIVSMQNAPGGLTSWGALLSRRFQPNVNTRISGVILFGSGQESTAHGEAVVDHSLILLNPYAHYPVPEWIRSLAPPRQNEPLHPNF